MRSAKRTPARSSSTEERKPFLSGNDMESRTEHQTIRRFDTLFYLNMIIGGVVFVLTVVWIFVFRSGFGFRADPGLEFNWHPFLMVLGMILLYSQAILLYRSRRYVPKRTLKLGHGFLHAGIAVLAVLGLVAAFDSHNLAVPPKPNLYTMHSWLGLTTAVAFFLQLTVGFLCFLFPGFPGELRRAVLPAHTAVGTGIFVAASFTAMMGFTEKAIFSIDKNYGKFVPETYFINFLAVLTALFCILTLYLVNEKDYKRETIPEDEIALTRNE